MCSSKGEKSSSLLSGLPIKHLPSCSTTQQVANPPWVCRNFCNRLTVFCLSKSFLRVHGPIGFLLHGTIGFLLHHPSRGLLPVGPASYSALSGGVCPAPGSRASVRADPGMRTFAVLPKPWSGGPTSFTLSPLALLDKLACARAPATRSP